MVLIAVSHDQLRRHYRGYKEQYENQSHGGRTKKQVLLSIKVRLTIYKEESICSSESGVEKEI